MSLHRILPFAALAAALSIFVAACGGGSASGATAPAGASNADPASSASSGNGPAPTDDVAYLKAVCTDVNDAINPILNKIANDPSLLSDQQKLIRRVHARTVRPFHEALGHRGAGGPEAVPRRARRTLQRCRGAGEIGPAQGHRRHRERDARRQRAAGREGPCTEYRQPDPRVPAEPRVRVGLLRLGRRP